MMIEKSRLLDDQERQVELLEKEASSLAKKAALDSRKGCDVGVVGVSHTDQFITKLLVDINFKSCMNIYLLFILLAIITTQPECKSKAVNGAVEVSSRVVDHPDPSSEGGWTLITIILVSIMRKIIVLIILIILMEL